MSTRNQPGYAVLAVAVVGLPLQRVTQHLVSLSKSLGIIHRKKKSQLVSTSYIYFTESSRYGLNQAAVRTWNFSAACGSLGFLSGCTCLA